MSVLKVERKTETQEKVLLISSSAGGRSKNLGGPALKDLDRLEHLVIPHYIESGKIWGRGEATAPLAPPVPPAL